MLDSAARPECRERDCSDRERIGRSG